MRKIIEHHLIDRKIETNGEILYRTIISALCDDGTLWLRYENKWIPVPEIPASLPTGTDKEVTG